MPVVYKVEVYLPDQFPTDDILIKAEYYLYTPGVGYSLDGDVTAHNSEDFDVSLDSALDAEYPNNIGS